MPEQHPFPSIGAEWNERLDRAWRTLSPMLQRSESFDQLRLKLDGLPPHELVDLAAVVLAQAYIAHVREEVRVGAMTAEEGEATIHQWLHGAPSLTARRFRRE